MIDAVTSLSLDRAGCTAAAPRACAVEPPVARSAARTR
jgi:hypothetical protein